MANRLKELGYATCCVGKWHLGSSEEYKPTKRGFDEFFGTLANTPFFHPTNFIDSRVSNDVREVTDENFYTTDAYAERSVDWLEKNKDKSWFLYVPFNAQHAPLQAPQKYLDRFPDIKDPKRQLFAAMLSAQDDAIGRVMTKVRELGQEENTLVFYIADNGGPTQSTTSQNGGLRGFKMTTYEGGPRHVLAIRTAMGDPSRRSQAGRLARRQWQTGRPISNGPANSDRDCNPTNFTSISSPGCSPWRPLRLCGETPVCAFAR